MKGWDVSRSVRNQTQERTFRKWGKTVQKITIKMQRAEWSFVREGKLAGAGGSGEGGPVQVPLAAPPSSLSPETSSAGILMTRYCQQVWVKACLFSWQRRNDDLQTSPTGNGFLCPAMACFKWGPRSGWTDGLVKIEEMSPNNHKILPPSNLVYFAAHNSCEVLLCPWSEDLPHLQVPSWPELYWKNGWIMLCGKQRRKGMRDLS